MYGAQEQRYAGDVALYHDKKQKKYNQSIGVEKIQSRSEKGYIA
jgi:hypothetical protein